MSNYYLTIKEISRVYSFWDEVKEEKAVQETSSTPSVKREPIFSVPQTF